MDDVWKETTPYETFTGCWVDVIVAIVTSLQFYRNYLNISDIDLVILKCGTSQLYNSVHFYRSSSQNKKLDTFLENNDCDRFKAYLAFRVYLNLAEVHGWRDVDIHYCANQNVPFITGRPTLSPTIEPVFPLDVAKSISHRQLINIFTDVRHEGNTFDKINLAICSSDSSIVYYSLTNDIVKPPSPEVADARKDEHRELQYRRRRHVDECVKQFTEGQMTASDLDMPPE